MTAPALFVGHGSPMNAIEDTPAARGWAEIATRYGRPRAIVVISAHWVTEGVRVMSNPHPRTIHDFGHGFPPELFAQQYPAPGDAALSRTIVETLSPFHAEPDATWGIDHGAWSVLKHMYPNADIPVIQVSLDVSRPPALHYEIGQKLAALRDDNVLILGSGNIVHNLPTFFRHQGQPTPWDNEFDAFILDAVARRDHNAVKAYASHNLAPRAAPDWEHFTPILYALAAQRDGESAEIFNHYFFPGIAMTSIAIGLPQ
jgi:4,5-DOPA dioxygenase extradiol